MLLRCCLIHMSIIIVRNFLYLSYLCPCLDLGLFMSYLRDLLFIFIFIFIMINCIISMNNFFSNSISLSDWNGTRTHDHLVRKRTEWLCVRLRTKWLWIRVPLQSLKLQISCLFQARNSLTFWQL